MSSWYPPPSKPRAVEGGIKARSARGDIAQTWWSKRFIDHLDGLGLQARLARGRTYARKGQVLQLDVDAGAVSASVQGSRARPYRVRIGVQAFGKEDWFRVVEALAQDAWFAAKLLAGQMPPDIEELFEREGLALFPASVGELTMDCSCPDWSVPCKHLAAVFYLLAEAFDADPFLILALRGRERADLLDALAALRTGTVPADRAEDGIRAVPLDACLEHFFECPEPATRESFEPPPADSLLDQLPDTAVTVRGLALTEVLRPVYRAAGR